MPEEPAVKRTCVFIDGQNLYWAARHAFGYHYPNYDPLPLSQAVTQSRDWNLDTIHFYTGLPDIRDDDFWNKFLPGFALQNSTKHNSLIFTEVWFTLRVFGNFLRVH